MKKFIRTPRALLLGVTALAVVLVGAGVASGTIGASKPNVYWACVPKDGRIKLVYPGSKCKPGERFITWHQKGQQSATVVQDGLQGLKGDAGAQGEAGAAGAKGTDGASGSQGAKGDKGENGAAGPKGDAGIDGLNGTNGVDGATGPKGDKGDTGAAGPQGEMGPAGPQGAKGDTGATGLQGETGPTGATGAKGDTGAAGPQGPAGPAGPAGANGAAGAPGSSAVSSYERVTYSTSVNNGQPTRTVTATCPVGKVAVGGGYEVMADDEDERAAITVVINRPGDDNKTWTVTASEDDGDAVGRWGISAYAVCTA